MRIERVKLVYFSPTGTTQKIVESIAEGIKAPVERIDMTHPTHAKTSAFGKELIIIGVPVYVGRVPALAAKRLRELKGNNTPVVLVVVYGNRAYEDALLELSDITSELGFKPVAGGAFVAEHSFSSAELPIARGRPDEADKAKAMKFGEDIREKLKSIEVAEIASVTFPGNHPYRDQFPAGRERPKPISPETVEEKCTKCGKCEEVCPAGAITVGSNVDTKKESCIRCYACIRSCPTGARVMLDQWFVSHTKVLHDNLVKRREPETFL
jgi:ferredoxin